MNRSASDDAGVQGDFAELLTIARELPETLRALARVAVLRQKAKLSHRLRIAAAAAIGAVLVLFAACFALGLALVGAAGTLAQSIGVSPAAGALLVGTFTLFALAVAAAVAWRAAAKQRVAALQRELAAAGSGSAATPSDSKPASKDLPQ